MHDIHYLVGGDATSPVGEGPKLILHICNDAGGWGAGFVLALSKKWSEPEEEYRKWWEEHKEASGGRLPLGMIQPVSVNQGQDEIIVMNMIAQRGYWRQGFPPISYDALHHCLSKIASWTITYSDRFDKPMPTIHMPRIGCGLAGGRWNVVEALIKNTLIEGGLEVFVYDFKGETE